jgi:hypothetical protein
MSFKTLLLEHKLVLQEEYVCALETGNQYRASFLRGKLSMLDEIIKETKEDMNG